LFSIKHQVDIPDGAEFVGIIGGTVVDDGKVELSFPGVVSIGPTLEVPP
jgi:hypothetical protein